VIGAWARAAELDRRGRRPARVRQSDCQDACRDNLLDRACPALMYFETSIVFEVKYCLTAQVQNLLEPSGRIRLAPPARRILWCGRSGSSLSTPGRRAPLTALVRIRRQPDLEPERLHGHERHRALRFAHRRAMRPRTRFPSRRRTRSAARAISGSWATIACSAATLRFWPTSSACWADSWLT
jgi:hypothetical protein